MYTNDLSDNTIPDPQSFHNFSNNDLLPIQDSDNDGLSDQEEIFRGTNPYNADTDGDGLSDSQELSDGMNPLLPDSDNDGIRDGVDWWQGPQLNQAFSSSDPQVSLEYERLSQGIDPELPPFLQAKQMAQTGLNEDMNSEELHKVLSETPRFKEIEGALGSQKAEEFAHIAITAAIRQNALGSLPNQPIQREPQTQQQPQPRLHTSG